MAHLLAPPAFGVEMEGGKGNSIRWVNWLRRFDLYIKAAELTSDRIKIATLLHGDNN